MRGISRVWITAAVPAALLAVAVFAIGALGATANSHRRGAGATVEILATGQKSILAHGLKVSVKASSPVKLTLRGSSSSFDRPRPSGLTKPVTVHLNGRRASSIRLPLTTAGRKAIASCAARDLRVSVRGSTSTTQMVRDTAACKPQAVDLSHASQCDFIGQQSSSLCMLPFPDDFYTVKNAASATGRRIHFTDPAMPANTSDVHISAAPYNLNDGFSPGQGIVVRIPGLDNATALQKTGAVPINHLGQFTKKNAPVIVLDATTGKRWPIWAEIDSNASTPATTALEIHPAKNFAAKHRYIVVLRNLKTSSGKTIPAPAGFRYYRDDLPSGKKAINKQRARFDGIFKTLRKAGIHRSNLYLAWDFTVASDENIAGRMLHIRDNALAVLGDTTPGDGIVDGSAPAFSVDTVDTNPKTNVARRVRGTYTVPCYLFPSCAAGGTFHLDSSGLPIRNGDWTANFDCTIPAAALSSPARPAVYGHGLFGSAGEVFGADIQNEFGQTYDVVLCATDEIGMSGSDVGNTLVNILPNLSNFPQLADRLQQGLLDELFLGRLMDTTAAQGGFLSDESFHADGATLGSPGVIDPSELYYDGSSQGGIMGGALTAVSTDFTRAALNVPAMNYSILLPRSVDYDEFIPTIYGAYPDDLSHPLFLSIIQMLWDRGEPDGYAHRMTTDPLPNTPPHKVLMGIALGDHQVSNFAADVEARTIGASTRTPILDPGRWPGVDVLWNVPHISSYPFNGSAAIYFDIGPVRDDPSNPGHNIGVPPPPLTNTPNRAGEDPHGAPRGAASGLHMLSDFLKPAGGVTNVCGITACYSGGWTGNP